MKMCHLLTYNPDITGGIETAVTHLRNGYDVKYLGAGGIQSIFKGIFAALKLRFSDYDVIHIHDNAGYWCTRLTRNKKLVYTTQGFWNSYFDANPPNGMGTKIASTVLTRMQTRLIKHSDVVVPINRNIEKKLRNMGIKPHFVIHNGVDTGLFRPSRGKKTFDYIWVGTNPESKRLKETIELSQKQGKRLLVVGTPGKSSANVVFEPNIRREKMPGMFNSAKTFIYFNKQSDYSIAMLEAMSCGLNILTLDYILAEITDSGKYAGKIYLDGKQARMKFLTGKTARTIAEKDLDWGVARSKYKSIYDNV